MTNNTTTIDLLRHGHCQGGEIFRGSTDVALSDKGWQQMRQALDAYLEDPPWQQIITSPLLRCRRFAEHLVTQTGSELSVATNYREMHFGSWEGKLIEHVWRNEREKIEQFYADPTKYSPPNGEDTPSFNHRVITALENHIKQFQGQHLLIIAHGGSFRVALCYALGLDVADLSRFEVPYAAFSRIKIHHDGPLHYPRLVFHNNR